MFAAPTSSGYLGGFRTNDLHWSDTDKCVMRQRISYFDLVRQRAEQQEANRRRMKLVTFLLTWVVMVPPRDHVITLKWKLLLWTRTTIYFYILSKLLSTIFYPDQLMPIYGDAGFSFGHLKLIMYLTCAGVSTFMHANSFLFRRNFDWTFYDTLADDGSDHNLVYNDEAILKTKLKKPNFSSDLLIEDDILNGMNNRNLLHDKGNLYLVSSHFYLTKHTNDASARDTNSRPLSPTMIQRTDEDVQPYAEKSFFSFRGNRVAHENQAPKYPTTNEVKVKVNADEADEQDIIKSWRYIVRLQFRQMLRVCRFDHMHDSGVFAGKATVIGIMVQTVFMSLLYFGAYFFIDRNKFKQQYPQMNESIQILYLLEFWYLYLEMIISALVFLIMYLLSCIHGIELSEKLYLQLKLCADECYEMFGSLHSDQTYASETHEFNTKKENDTCEDPLCFHPNSHNELYKLHQRIVWLLNSIQMYSFYLSDRTRIWVFFLSGGVLIVNFLFISITWQMTLVITELKESSAALLRVLAGAMSPLFYYCFLAAICTKTGELHHKFEKFDIPIRTIEALLPAYGRFKELKSIIRIKGNMWKRRARTSILGILPLTKMTMFLALSWSGSIILALRQGFVYM